MGNCQHGIADGTFCHHCTAIVCLHQPAGCEKCQMLTVGKYARAEHQAFLSMQADFLKMQAELEALRLRCKCGTAPKTKSLEIRCNDDRTLDEIVACHPIFFHLEQMADNHWWLVIDTTDGHSCHVNLSTSKTQIQALVETEKTSDKPHRCTLCDEENKNENPR